MCITRKIIKPADCMMGICIPLNKKSLKKNLSNSLSADFGNNIHWPLYEYDTLLPFEKLKPLIKRLKVGLKEEFTFNDLDYFLNKSIYKVIILVAHWKDPCVEFFDSFHDSREVLNIFPEDKEVILDLNICTCKSLGDILGINRRFSLVKYNFYNDRSQAGAWFLFYKFLFQLIHEKDILYVDALNLTKETYKDII